MKPRVSLVCFNPQGRIEIPAASGLINPRMKNLEGKKITIIRDGKKGGDNFCIAVEELLNERYPTATTIRLVWGDAEAGRGSNLRVRRHRKTGTGGFVPAPFRRHRNRFQLYLSESFCNHCVNRAAPGTALHKGGLTGSISGASGITGNNKWEGCFRSW